MFVLRKFIVAWLAKTKMPTIIVSWPHCIVIQEVVAYHCIDMSKVHAHAQ